MTDRPQLDLDNYLPYLLNRVGFAMVESFTASALAVHGLSIDMWRVLAALSNRGDSRQVDLAAMTSIDPSTISRLVTRLVRMGYVTRGRSKTSSREVVVGLSGKGVAFMQRTIPVAGELEAISSKGVAGKDMAVVKRALRQMYRNLAATRRSAERTG